MTSSAWRKAAGKLMHTFPPCLLSLSARVWCCTSLKLSPLGFIEITFWWHWRLQGTFLVLWMLFRGLDSCLCCPTPIFVPPASNTHKMVLRMVLWSALIREENGAPQIRGPGHLPLSMDLASDVQIQRPSWAHSCQLNHRQGCLNNKFTECPVFSCKNTSLCFSVGLFPPISVSGRFTGQLLTLLGLNQQGHASRNQTCLWFAH